jgi:hypothetical protein
VRLSEPQQLLLDEIREAGVLYIRRWSRYRRTVDVLCRKGLVRMVEPDHSSMGMDGYALAMGDE